jgi:protein gp37/ParB-like chromosome segregation protein Spo0J
MTDVELTQHPLSAAFPTMTDAVFAELRADIAQNGLHHPIIVFEEQVLDGWHRYRACQEVGVPVRTQQFEGDEAAARKFVVSANLMRRHLDASQRGMVGARLAQIPHGGDRKSDQDVILRLEDAADLMNVSEKTISDSRTVLASGDTELINKVESGEQSASSAAKQVRQSKPRAAPRSRASAPPPAIEIVPKTVTEWAAMPAAEQAAYLAHRNPEAKLNAQKSGEDDNLIDWAKWTWNPITGCLHNCPYCYARDISERFAGTPAFPNGFAPTFRADRLAAPLNARPRNNDDLREGRIFTGSMTDLFGRWVPAEWIEASLSVMRLTPQWEFLMLTKFPKRMAEFDIPANAWAGTSVDCQTRVTSAEAAFADIGGKYHWLSCEPLIEPLRFQHLDRFHLLVIGGASASSSTPKWIPPYAWIDDLRRQADEVGCAVYIKSNLYLKEDPGGSRYGFFDRAPEVFHYLALAQNEDQKAA